MRAARKLVLRQERLTELTGDDLRAVLGGAPEEPTKDCPDYTYYCLTGYAMCERPLSKVLCP